MPRMLVPPAEFERMIRRRKSTGSDRFDEVWDGVYVLSPLADNLHQLLVGHLVRALYEAIPADAHALLLPGANVSDRAKGWKKNYRCPDVLVFLPGNPAEDCGTHWFGGPDFAVEVLSPGDRARKKLGFYAGVGVRELMLIDRKPWRLELYRLEGGAYGPAVVSDPAGGQVVRSAVLPLTFRLIEAQPRPRVDITRPTDGRAWLI